MAEQDSKRGGRLSQSAKGSNGTDVARRLIVTIGIDAYRHMPRLQNAVGDAAGVHKLFTEKLDFEAPFPPLVDGDATKRAIKELVEEKLPEEVGDDDAVVLFFAGHGKSRRLRTGELGYLVPVDGRSDGRWADYLRIDNFFNSLNNMDARHIVVILDACHSGFALGKAMVVSRREIPSFARELQRRKSRHVLTSALPEQEALDGGPVTGHSLFTAYLLHGLRAGLADRGHKGAIMTSELGQYVQESVAAYSNGRQTPVLGRFAPWADEQGELLFKSLAVNVPQQPPASPHAPNESPAGVSPLQHVWALRQMLQDPGMAAYARQQLQLLADGEDELAAGAARAALAAEDSPPVYERQPPIIVEGGYPETGEAKTLDDPRWEQGIVPDPPIIHTLGGLEFVEIPAGEFWMGSDGGSENEKPAHKLYLETYWIGRTPITNAQYRKFLNTTEREPEKDWQIGEKGSYPAIYVSWLVALAYCRWLSEHTGVPVTLPSEAEWEKAARGPQGLLYPWGNEFNSKRCNTREGGPGTTTPVDRYPQGASPYSLLDLSGNVWEWTRTMYSGDFAYPYQADDGREAVEDVESPRVLRGGSWRGYASYARTSYRIFDRPHARHSNMGFRVAVPRPPNPGR